jgi:hypothetical protein
MQLPPLLQTKLHVPRIRPDLPYLITALNQFERVEATFGKGTLSLLQSPQPPGGDPGISPPPSWRS